MPAQQFVVAKDDLKTTALIDLETGPAERLPDDALLLKVDRFAFTANNMTYAVLGDQLHYWSLFPAPRTADLKFLRRWPQDHYQELQIESGTSIDNLLVPSGFRSSFNESAATSYELRKPGTSGYGNIPVWGFGEVIESRHEQIEQGERLFGYFPMATHLVIEAADVNKRGLRDGAAHRQGVSPVYNAYSRIGSDPAFAGKQGDYQALLRPLFMLSFMVDDFLAEHKFFGATQVILSSASSKTAFGLAHLLHQRDGLRVIGLTSAANEAFVRSLGCYDDVVSYDGISALARETTAYVDMAGSADLRRHLHAHFAEKLVYSGRVGLTHLDPDQGDADMPGAKPVWFFAPDQIRKRAKEWGPGGLDQRFGEAWTTLVPQLDRWIGVTETRGPEGVQQIYLDTLGGKVSPSDAHMLSLWR